MSILHSFGPMDDRSILRLFWLLLVSLPLSVKIYFQPIDLEVIFPAEPLLGLLLLLLVVKAFKGGFGSLSWRSFILHPVSIVVLGFLLVSFISAAFSTMPLVSVKAVLVRSTYVLLFYVALGVGALGGAARIGSALITYGKVFLPIVLFTWMQQAQLGFDRRGAGFVSFPFYTDHTVYAAALVFMLFAFAFKAASVPIRWPDVKRRWLPFLATAILIVALCLSYCRAAWVSVVVALAFLVLLMLRVRFGQLMVALTAGCAVLVLARQPLTRAMQANTVDSTADHVGVVESLLSLTNISHDASNQERINRWSCAYRMFEQHPWTGHGPGTFQFGYLALQRPEEMTYLSMNGPIDPLMVTRAWSMSEGLFVRSNPQVFYLSGGTAHSEYLLALSEMGLGGLVAFVVLALISLVTGMRLYAASSGADRYVVLASLLSLVAYFAHAFFNNFLDDCKVAFLFWASIALLVRLDLERRSSDGGRPVVHPPRGR